MNVKTKEMNVMPEWLIDFLLIGVVTAVIGEFVTRRKTHQEREEEIRTECEHNEKTSI